MNLRFTLFLLCLTLVFNTVSAQSYQQIPSDILMKAKALEAANSTKTGSGLLEKKTDEMTLPEDRGVVTEKRDTISRDSLKLRDLKPKIDPKNTVFGRDIFSGKNLTFTPNYNMPTPKDYVLAGGDELIIEVWGNSEMSIRRTISPEGTVSIENIGLVNVNGLTIEQAENRIKSKLGQIMGDIGSSTKVNVSLGKIRSIKVNISGEVVNPGTYTLPSLATVFNAIYSAGGVNDIGSLRRIEVFRASQPVATLDVYDFIINGKYKTNIRLEDNDMIIVSPYMNHVKISGMVKRERIYEMKEDESMAKLIEYAGGFRGEAYTDNVKIRRKSGRMYQILTVDRENFNSTGIKDADEVTVGEVVDRFSNRITIDGAVMRPGEYELSQNLNTLSALIEKAEGLSGDEFATRGIIKRLKPNRMIETVSFDVSKVVSGETDITLLPEDDIFIPRITDLMEEQNIEVFGEVNNSGKFGYFQNMTVGDVIVMAGGFSDAATVSKIDVSRRVRDPYLLDYTPTKAELFSFSISKDLNVSDPVNNFRLEPFDQIFIRRSPVYSEQKNTVVKGEVLFEGTYTLAKNGDRLTDLVKKSGGLTPEAYIKGANLRRKLSDDERAKVESMMRIARGSGSKKDSVAMDSINIDDFYAVGIDLQQALKYPGGLNDVILQEGDVLYIPQKNNTVKISGGVLHSNTVTYDRKMIKRYISQAGGYVDNARKRPYVVYMNGTVNSTKSYLFFKRYPTIEPGCEIIVPVKLPRPNRMGASEILGLSLSAASTAAVISTLIK